MTAITNIKRKVSDAQIDTAARAIETAINSALAPLFAAARGEQNVVVNKGEGPGARMMANGKRDRGFLVPADDDDQKPVTNSRGFTPPKGE